MAALSSFVVTRNDRYAHDCSDGAAVTRWRRPEYAYRDRTAWRWAVFVGKSYGSKGIKWKSQGLKPLWLPLDYQDEGTTSWHSLQNCSRDSSDGRPLHSNYQHNRRCYRYPTTSTSLATGCTQCWWLHWRTVKLRNMYLFCISCK